MNENTEQPSAHDQHVLGILNSLNTRQKLVGICLLAAPVIGVVGGIVSIAKTIVEVTKK